ncbi:MAG: ferrous iron transport protein A [Proteobacteria bacterium]|nr:MAG: ferrous iron transport protein A [Pseudomonadota bacterium]
MVTLWEAPFAKNLRVRNLDGLAPEVRVVLTQLGLDHGETVEKRHAAPLGDPITLRIGSQLFTLRKNICQFIEVELAEANL